MKASNGALSSRLQGRRGHSAPRDKKRSPPGLLIHVRDRGNAAPCPHRECYRAFPFMDVTARPHLQSRHATPRSRPMTPRGSKRGTAKDLATTGRRSILDYDKWIVQTRNCELQEVKIESTIFNANGLQAETRKTIYTLACLQMEKRSPGMTGRGATRLTIWSPYHWADGSLKRQSPFSIQGVATGAYEELCTPGAACDMLLRPLSSGRASTKTRRGRGRVETAACFSPFLNITDSGTSGHGPLSFDGEGVPSQETRWYGGLFSEIPL